MPRVSSEAWQAPQLSPGAEASDSYVRATEALNLIFARTQLRDYRLDDVALARLDHFRAQKTLAPLIDALNADNVPTRAAAAWVAGELKDRRLLPALSMRLADDSGTVRDVAGWAVGRIETSRRKQGKKL
jgi:hypothetical protein